MNTISKCLFGGALLGAGLSSPAIGGDVVWGAGSSFTYAFGDTQSSFVSGDWNLASSNSYGASASSVANTLGLSMLANGASSFITGSASVDRDFTVSHDMLISFEWDFTGSGNAAVQITDSLSNSIFNQITSSSSSAPVEITFMAGETYNINGTLLSYSASDIFRFTMTGGNDINVVPLPPAALAGLGMLAGLGAYRRVRR